MKYLLALLMLFASPAWAEWTVSGGSDEFTQYIDIATIRRNGNFVKMWDLKDFKTVEKISDYSFLSQKVQSEYDCKEERERLLAFSWFSGKMGSGTVVYSDNDPTKWIPIQPDSVAETLWKIVCGKK